MLLDGLTNSSGQESQPYRNRKEDTIQESMFRGTTNERQEMYDHTGNNERQRTSNKGLKKNVEAIVGRPSVDSVQTTATWCGSKVMRLATLCTNRQCCCLLLHLAVRLTPAVDSVQVLTCYSCYEIVESV